ncbi:MULTISPECIES: helix-turn-helix domain-containing protein [Serratia]|nr:MULTISPECIES: helix-turn-helix transcriptional regulator [Bacteria]AIM24279.1 putative transcriptional regulator [Serratia sp. SCBI]MBH3029566.1 helix-turn-helix transcriptional regulator [Serratia marcescens]MBH3043937.1 helix-turn-helix transcriptional regulator [Serratia marcescens]MBH3259164.1 helix-turn-helix transcriptional regulator [Serratia marcescens]
MIPKRLKDARISNGYTQEQLAELVGIQGANSSSRLSSYEVGRTEPPFSLVVKIANLLDYPEYYFYTIDDDLASDLLEMHRNRTNPSKNEFYSSVIEEKKLAKKVEDAKRLAIEIIDCLNK